MMDAPTSQAPTKKVEECMKEAEGQETAEQPQGGKSATRRLPTEMLRIKHWNRSNWPKEAAEEPSQLHREL